VSRRIEIVEVGPRDGLQNEAAVLSLAQKLDYIDRLEDAGARRIETVSFVNPKRVPQMAGAEEICAALPHQDGRSRIGLVLNVRGWDRLVASGGCDEANVVVCATDSFARANQGADVEGLLAMLREVGERQAREGGPPLSVTVSVAFGCPFEGEVSEDQLARVLRVADELAIPELALADTIGAADPWLVRRRIELARKLAPNARLRMHFHDTRNTGLANAFASVDAGIDVLDASCGGLGGCPFAPKATGNIGTEDLVYMLERAGFTTGYDLAKLISTALWMAELVGKPPAASVSRAGVFPRPAPVRG
jgi:hydroxymethylglutaryl-CoA lyase